MIGVHTPEFSFEHAIDRVAGDDGHALRSASRRPAKEWDMPQVDPSEPADEVAEMLESTVESVDSARKRARAGLRRRLPAAGDADPPPAPGSPAEQALVAGFVRAYESGDVETLVALLTADVDRICAITHFDRSVLATFGLPRSLPGR